MPASNPSVKHEFFTLRGEVVSDIEAGLHPSWHESGGVMVRLPSPHIPLGFDSESLLESWL